MSTPIPYPLEPPLDLSDFDASELRNFDAQVAGHPSTVFRTRAGKIIVKRSLPSEISFYYRHLNPNAAVTDKGIQQANGHASPASCHYTLTDLTPKCHGAVTLSEAEKKSDSSHGSNQAGPMLPELIELDPAIPFPDQPIQSVVANALVLENILHGFVSPSVLDIKLGTQLWDDSSSPEKKARMIKSAQTCTSGEYGLRLTGWQTWDDERKTEFNVSKSFGKSILTQAHLELGARIFFCSPRLPDDAPEFDRILTKQAPAASAQTASAPATQASSLLPTLPADLIHHVITRGLAPQLRNIFNLVRTTEWRVRGGSVLLVYEGNADALRSRIQDSAADPRTYCQARLIDFAHANFVPGQGPDEGYVLGLQTAMTLLDHVAAETASPATT
ncbi:hypothetical protein OC861_004890 [Tilletia horrida]|nr:hypothetical protein OC861_004890 [Tilletia horrida]